MIRRLIDIVAVVAILVVIGLAILNREKFVSMSKTINDEDVVTTSENANNAAPADSTQYTDIKTISNGPQR